MALSARQQKQRFTLLSMALSMQGAETSVQKAIDDAELMNKWIVGDFIFKDESHSLKVIGRDDLKEFANNYAMQNYQNAGQYKTIALIVKNNKEYDCLSVAFYDRTRIKYLDFHVFHNSQEAAEILRKMNAHSILHDDNIVLSEMLIHKKFENVKCVSINNSPCFSLKNRVYFKRNYDFAIFHTVNALKTGIFSAIHPKIKSEIVGVLDDLKFTEDAKYEFSKNPKSLSITSYRVINCLSLLFAEHTINMTFED